MQKISLQGERMVQNTSGNKGHFNIFILNKQIISVCYYSVYLCKSILTCVSSKVSG